MPRYQPIIEETLLYEIKIIEAENASEARKIVRQKIEEGACGLDTLIPIDSNTTIYEIEELEVE